MPPEARQGWTRKKAGGDGGIRTLDRALQPYNGLANRRLQPLGHISGCHAYARRVVTSQAPDRMPGFRIGGLLRPPASNSAHPPARKPHRQADIRRMWTTRGRGLAPARCACFNGTLGPSPREGAQSGVALRWQVAILRILAAQADGEASVAALARDLSILMTSKESQPPAAPRSLSTSLFVDGLIERPGKGRWRISAAGRAYLQALESPLAEAAE